MRIVTLLSIAFLIVTSSALAEQQLGAGEAAELTGEPIQSAPEGEEPQAPESTSLREEIVVTATRYEVDSFATPIPVTVISELELERQKPEKITDVLKQVAGIEVFGEGPFRGLPVIRGLSSNRVLLLVDGQRLNNARESTEFAGTQPGLVDLRDVERIEVLRGPASVLYGSDALGGVINIITKQPRFSPQGFACRGTVGLEYGTAAEARRGQAAVSAASERFTFRLGGSAFEASNYESPEGVIPNSGMKQRSMEGNLRLLVSDNSILRFDVQAVRTSDIGFPGYDPATSGVDINFPRFDRDKVAVAYEVSDIIGLQSLTVSAYGQQVVKESKRNLNFGFFFLNNFTRSDIDSLGFNAQARAILGSHALTFGLDAYQDRLDDTTTAESPFGSSNEVAVPDSTQRGFGVYLQDQIPLGARFKLEVGLRGDRFTFASKDDFDYTGEPFDVAKSALSGSVAARYEVTRHVALTALVGRGFRAPNIQERAFFGLASTGDTWILQNPDLDSETSLNVEAGFKVRYPDYSGGFNVFRNSVKNLIGLVFLGEDPNTGLDLAKFDNIDKAIIEGAELELEHTISESWITFLTASYTRGTDEATGQPLSFIPPLKGVLGIRYQAPIWWAEAAMRSLSRQDRVPTLPEPAEPSPGFTTFDIRGGFDLFDSFTVQAAVENITDKAYHEPFNRRFEPGRNFKLALGYRF